MEFFEVNKNRKMAIVTSCNKKAVNYILQVTGLNKFVDLVIASEDCTNHKPDPEPYLKAIKYFNADIENVFIFEDSYSGYCSAKRTNVKNICVIVNKNSCSEILTSKQFKYNDYVNLKINNIIQFYMQSNNDYVADYIKQIK